MTPFKFFQKEQVKGTLDIIEGETYSTASFWHRDTHGNAEQIRMRIEDEERAYRRFNIGRVGVRTVKPTMWGEVKNFFGNMPLKIMGISITITLSVIMLLLKLYEVI